MSDGRLPPEGERIEDGGGRIGADLGCGQMSQLLLCPEADRSPEDARLLAAHLTRCAPCRAAQAQLDALDQRLGILAKEATPAASLARMDARFAARHVQPRVGATPSPLGRLAERLGLSSAALGWGGAAVGVALMLLVGIAPLLNLTGHPDPLSATLLGASQPRSVTLSAAPRYFVGEAMRVRLDAGHLPWIHSFQWARGAAILPLPLGGSAIGRYNQTMEERGALLPPADAPPLEVSGGAGLEAIVLIACDGPQEGLATILEATGPLASLKGLDRALDDALRSLREGGETCQRWVGPYTIDAPR